MEETATMTTNATNTKKMAAKFYTKAEVRAMFELVAKTLNKKGVTVSKMWDIAQGKYTGKKNTKSKKSPYLHFLDDFRADLDPEQRRDIKNVARMGGAAWGKLTADEKQVYVVRAEEHRKLMQEKAEEEAKAEAEAEAAAAAAAAGGATETEAAPVTPAPQTKEVATPKPTKQSAARGGSKTTEKKVEKADKTTEKTIEKAAEGGAKKAMAARAKMVGGKKGLPPVPPGVKA